jgi:hypothetical protein
MELIIAIVIVVAFVAVWYNRRSPEGKIEFVAETTSDNGIIFVAPAAPAPVVAESTNTVTETAPVEKAKKPRAKKPAVVAKTATVKKTATTKKAPAKKPAK